MAVSSRSSAAPFRASTSAAKRSVHSSTGVVEDVRAGAASTSAGTSASGSRTRSLTLRWYANGAASGYGGATTFADARPSRLRSIPMIRRHRYAVALVCLAALAVALALPDAVQVFTWLAEPVA